MPTWSRVRVLARIAVAAAVSASIAGCPAPQPPEPPPVPTPVPPKPIDPTAADPEAFRKTPPPAGPEVRFVAPAIHEARLDSGLRVLVVERHELPIVALQVVIDRGADQGTPGLGGFVGAMLVQGTKSKSALELSDAFDRLGASYGSWADFDSCGVRAQVLAPGLGAALDLVADVVQNPAFAKAEVERERARRLTAIQQQNDSPNALLAKATAQALYPEKHPYAATLLGTEADVKAIKPADLAKFHATHFRPDHATVVLAGDITKDRAVEEVKRAFGAWKGKAPEATVPTEPAAPANVCDAGG
jgi:zinc protease